MNAHTQECEEVRRTMVEHLAESPQPSRLTAALRHASSCAACSCFVAQLGEVVRPEPARAEAATALPANIRRRALARWSRPRGRLRAAWLAALTSRRVPLYAAVSACLLVALLCGGLSLHARLLGPSAGASHTAMENTSYNMRSSAVWQLCDTTQHDRAFGIRL
jgi:hypothetical protein